MSSNPFAEIEITASSRSLGEKLNEARGKVASWAKSVESATAGAFKGFGKGFGKLAGGAGKAFGLGSIGGVGFKFANAVVNDLEDAAASAKDFDEKLVRLQISSHQTPEAMEALRTSIRAASQETGISSNQILDGARAYQEFTGVVAGPEGTRGFARIAQATGSATEDIAHLAAVLRDMNIEAKDTEPAFSGLAEQGKAGRIELRNMVTEMPSLIAMFKQFKGGTGLGGLNELGADFQVIAHNFADASSTATGFESLMTAFTKHSDRLRHFGVQVFDDKGKMRSFRDIVGQIEKSKLMRNPTALVKTLGREEAVLAFNALKDYAGEYDELINKGKDYGSVQRDLNTYLTSGPGKMTLAWNKFRETLAGVFTPERIEKFAHVLAWALDKAAALVGEIEKIGKFIDVLSGDDYDEHSQAASSAAFESAATNRAIALSNAIGGVGGGNVGAQSSMARHLLDSRAVGAQGTMDRATGAHLIAQVIQDHLPNLGVAKVLAREGIGAGRFAAGANGIARTVAGPLQDAKLAVSLLRAADAMQAMANRPIVVKIGDDEVAKAQADAPRHRLARPH